MVDLGQKRWKRFHLFYWNKVKEKKKGGKFQNLKFPAFLFKANGQKEKSKIFFLSAH